VLGVVPVAAAFIRHEPLRGAEPADAEAETTGVKA
jgi:hypothetical protein